MVIVLTLMSLTLHICFGSSTRRTHEFIISAYVPGLGQPQWQSTSVNSTAVLRLLLLGLSIKYSVYDLTSSHLQKEEALI